MFYTNCEKDFFIYVYDMYTVLLMFSVNTDFKLSALGPSGSFVWVALLSVYHQNESPFLGTVASGVPDVVPEVPLTVRRQNDHFFHPTTPAQSDKIVEIPISPKHSGHCWSRARSRGNTVSSRARRHGARERAARAHVRSAVEFVWFVDLCVCLLIVYLCSCRTIQFFFLLKSKQ